MDRQALSGLLLLAVERVGVFLSIGKMMCTLKYIAAAGVQPIRRHHRKVVLSAIKCYAHRTRLVVKCDDAARYWRERWWADEVRLAQERRGRVRPALEFAETAVAIVAPLSRVGSSR